MAKINLTTQHNQENLSALASLGVLICMIVTVVGIKLWWFKHRLSFEQKTTSPPNVGRVNGGTTSAVLVPRRSKQPKYKRDKRYSQEIYESVEVHGVFRQKREDDYEIRRPLQLPPVRIRQTSEGDSVLIRPPPRTKRRDQVHSTAFEDLEIAKPSSLATASSSDLSAIPELNTKITLTFEEFERQFNLKEIKAASANNETNEIPKPPLRLNRRSTTTMTKPEKPERFLKASQSITIPEFHKVIEKRSVGLSSPQEDLTQIDFYEKTKIFDNFTAQPKKTKSTGYIKYEEVDDDLHEKQLNNEIDKQDYNFVDSGFYESPTAEKSLKTQRNQRLNYNDINESTSEHCTKEFNFSGKPHRTNEWDEEDFNTQNCDMKSNKTKEHETKDSIYCENSNNSSAKTEELNELEQDSTNFKKKFGNESKTVKEEATSVSNDNSIKACQDAKLLKSPEITGKEFKTDFQTPTETQNIHEHIITTDFISINYPKTNDEYTLKNRMVNGKKSQEFCQETPTTTAVNTSSASFEQDLDNQYESWPQFEEKIETPQVTVRRFNSNNLEANNSFNDNDYLESSIICSYKNENGNDDQAGFSLKERRPTGYAKYRPESPEFEDIEEWQEAFNNKFYNQVRSFITAEPLRKLERHEVSFDPVPQKQQIKNKSNKALAIRQRRPTGYVKHNEYFVTFNDESDEDINDDGHWCNVDTSTLQLPKVRFENEQETEKFTLNQRRPTEFVGLLNKDETEGMVDSQVEFDETSFSNDIGKNYHSIVKQRRPTGFIKELEIQDLLDNKTTRKNPTKESVKSNDSKKDELSQNGPTVRFVGTEENVETTAESLVKQRRPTGYVRQEISPDPSFTGLLEAHQNGGNKTENRVQSGQPTGYLRQMTSSDSPATIFLETDTYFEDAGNKTKPLLERTDTPTVRFSEIEKSFNDYATSTESLVKQKKPTEYGRQEELLPLQKRVNFQFDIENNERSQRSEAIQQRRPTGFIRKEEITKQVNFQLEPNLPQDDNSEYVNEHLKQRRPTGFVSGRKELKRLNPTAPIYQPSNDANSNQDFDDHLWQELEKDVAQDVTQNFEEEFAKIRHSYELNEADFLELKDELQKSPTEVIQQPLGFGKSIEDDWENFEKLKSQVIIKTTPIEEKIRITFSDNDLSNTTSILKDAKLEECIQPKPRKSKVTFDFKTEEHVIPARQINNCSEDDTAHNEYNKPLPPLPPQPLKRSSNTNYNNETTFTSIVAIPTSITLFGSKISTEDKQVEDSWSAIRKHRNMTNMQNFPTDSSHSLSTASLNTPPKPAYRNPMAQMAIQRAKEVRADMDGFKSRSINDRKSAAGGKQKQGSYNLSNVDHEDGTEA